MKVVKKPSPENKDGVNYEEEEITEDSPIDPEKYDPEVRCVLYTLGFDEKISV